MIAHAVVQIARQVGGDEAAALTSYVGVVFHKVFLNKSKADVFAIKISEDASKKGEQTMMTPHGPIKVVVGEVGVHAIEIEE
jgi:hypothetical protein